MTDDRISRRALLAAAAGVLGARAVQRTGFTQEPQDPTKVPGAPVSQLGQRSPFNHPRRVPVGGNQGASLTPLQALCGTVTPSDLHFGAHHAGVPALNPHAYTLLIHATVARPTVSS